MELLNHAPAIAPAPWERRHPCRRHLARPTWVLGDRRRDWGRGNGTQEWISKQFPCPHSLVPIPLSDSSQSRRDERVRIDPAAMSYTRRRPRPRRRRGPQSSEEEAAYHRARKSRPTIERRRSGLQSSEEEAAYNRARKKRPTEYTENTELQETEIDAAGIKIHGKHGITRDRDRCRRHQNTRKTRNYKRPR
jgi:hypothetical protein